MPSKGYEEDSRLVTACIQGGAKDWQEFVDRYDPRIRYTVAAVCTKCGVNSHEGEDMTAHVYEKLVDNDYRRLRAWRAQSSFATYLVQVTRNLSLDYLRKHNKGHRVEHFGDLNKWLENQPNPPQEGLGDSEIAALKSAIEELPNKQAMIMRLRVKGKTLREIATLMGIPKGTVFGENARAIEILRQKLRDASDTRINHANNTPQDQS